MQDTITLEEAQASLKEIIRRLRPGHSLVITENGQPVAKLIGELSNPPTPEQRERMAAGLRAVFGKWPGDETDEEIEEALRKLS